MPLFSVQRNIEHKMLFWVSSDCKSHTCILMPYKNKYFCATVWTAGCYCFTNKANINTCTAINYGLSEKFPTFAYIICIKRQRTQGKIIQKKFQTNKQKLRKLYNKPGSLALALPLFLSSFLVICWDIRILVQSININNKGFRIESQFKGQGSLPNNYWLHTHTKIHSQGNKLLQ